MSDRGRDARAKGVTLLAEHNHRRLAKNLSY